MERQQGTSDGARKARKEKRRSQMERGRGGEHGARAKRVRTDARNGQRNGNEVPGNNDRMREIKQEPVSEDDYEAAEDLVHIRGENRVENTNEEHPHMPAAPRDIKEEPADLRDGNNEEQPNNFPENIKQEPAEARGIPEEIPRVDYESRLILSQLHNNSWEGEVTIDGSTIDEVKPLSIGWLKIRAANASHISLILRNELPTVLQEEKHGHWEGANYNDFKSFVDNNCDRLRRVYILCSGSATRVSLKAVCELFKRPELEIRVRIGKDATDERPHEPQMYFSMIDELDIDDHLSRNTLKSILRNRNLKRVQLNCKKHFDAEEFLEEWKRGERCIQKWKLEYYYTILEKDNLPTEKTILKNQDGSKELLIDKKTFHLEKKVMISFSERSSRPFNVLPPNVAPRVAVSMDELRNLLQAVEDQTRETTAAQFIGVQNRIINDLVREIQAQANQIDTLQANQNSNRIQPVPNPHQYLNHINNILQNVNQFPGFNFPGLQ